MSNKQKYDKVFIDLFSVDENALANNLEYNTIPAWDSIGHATMIAALEEAFGITIDMDDIIDFSSYKKGMELLAKYKVTF